MSASSAQRATTAERRSKAVALRLAGMELALIKEKLGYASVAAASKDIKRAMEAHLATQERSTEMLLATELARLDRLQAGHWAAATSGSHRSAEVVLKVIDRRIRLLKLEAADPSGQRARSLLGDLAAALKVAADNLPPEGAEDADDEDPPATAGFLGGTDGS
jgi:hypothetical protein